MRGGVLPPALLFCALGIALGCVRRRAWVPSLLGLVVTLVVFLVVPVPRDHVEEIFFACWTSVIVTAASVHFVQRFGRWLPMVMSLNAGAWASAVVDISGSRLDLVKAFPCVLLALPTSWIVERIGLIPIKVISSWFIAVATLAAVLQLLPVTPGYLPDHLE